MKKLPIELDNQVNGECWTFYKLAILKAYKIANPWLASHIEFYINENMCGGYGNADCDYYRMRYFQDIFSICQIPIHRVIPERVVETVISNINSGRYIMIYLNYESQPMQVSSHECLIYGYDAEKMVFYCPGLVDGLFKEVELPFEDLQMLYSNAYRSYMENGWNLLNKRSYYFGITSISVNDDYINDNWISDYIERIDHEIHGMEIIQHDLSTDKKRVCYTGNACYYALINSLNSFITTPNFDDELMKRIIRTIKMLHDYKALFVTSVQWFIEAMDAYDNSELKRIEKEFSEFVFQLQSCYILLCKYLKTSHREDLIQVKDMLVIQRISNERLLLEYRELIWPFYYAINGVPMPPEDD